ncbi:MAG: hypothetical protein HY906_01950 [Deltaproteobacteria bacterium]|nr:hypothetical protein [Deltaproteobacteria bacterium]
MPILSTIELTLKDDASEQAFLAAFTRAAGGAADIPGLLELKAHRQLGADRRWSRP